jgi:hypothetical protein
MSILANRKRSKNYSEDVQDSSREAPPEILPEKMKGGDVLIHR